MTRAPRRDALLLVAVALLARAITFGNPIVHVDEQFYFVTARAMAHGAWPYADVWDRKPVGLFLLYWPAALLPLSLGIWAYQAIALACAVATAWMIAALARVAGWRAGATLAGVAYLLWINLAEGQGGQSPIFYNVLVAGAAMLIVGRHGAEPVRGLAAMALVGVAMQVKYSVVFEGMVFGLWIVAQHWRAHRRAGLTLALAVALVAAALVPTIAAGAVFAAAGRSGAFWYANFQSILERRADPWGEQLGNLAGVVLILSPLVAMAGITLAQRQWSAERMFLFAWLAAALLGLVVFGSWFDHYALPVMVPAATCAAGALGEHRRVNRWALPILAVVAVGGQVLLLSKRLGRGTPSQFAAVVAAVGRGPGCLWVQSGEPMLYAATGRCRATRYVFPSHLGRERERGAIGVDQAAEVRRILAGRPAVIVMRPAYRGERGDIRALVLAGLQHHYRRAAAVRLGRGIVSVYARR
jgi:hypothetical protein